MELNPQGPQTVAVAEPPDESQSPDAAPSLRADTLADSVVILLGLTVVQRMIGFVRAVLFCRWLDPEQLGQWDMAFSFLLLAAPVSMLALTASFGRYVEHFRRRGQLRTLFGRSAVFCASMAAVAWGILYVGREWFSQLIFGTPDRTELVVLLSCTLMAVIAMNYFIDVLTALRYVRLLAVTHLFTSAAFATLGISLLLGWQNAAASAVTAYGAACCLSVIGVICFTRRTWQALPVVTRPAPHRDFWGKLIPYAAWVWVASLMANLFDVADRYMIIHCSPTDSAAALGWVGQYHSSRVVPLLLVSVALMLGGMIVPHLSCDWEAGRRASLVRRLNLFLKLLGFALSAAAVGVMFAAPLLFGVAFQGKFAGGLAVLPWTLTYSIWFGLAMVAQNYLLCAEKARLTSLALLIGLGVNIVLNLLLLPRLGLLGAVLATSAANAIALALICAFNRLLGFHLDRGTRVAMAVPICFCLGPWIALSILAVVALDAIFSDHLLDRREKQQLAEIWNQYRQRLKSKSWA